MKSLGNRELEEFHAVTLVNTSIKFCYAADLTVFSRKPAARVKYVIVIPLLVAKALECGGKVDLPSKDVAGRFIKSAERAGSEFHRIEVLDSDSVIQGHDFVVRLLRGTQVVEDQE